MKRLLLAGLCMTGVLVPFQMYAAGSFKDVSEKSTEFAAVEFLKAQGIMQGYSDGTFRSAQKVTRAEAVKILVSSKLSTQEIASYTKTSYTDVPGDAWYRPYVEAAFLKLSLIDGPPKTTAFRGGDGIRQAEFLKLLFKSQGIDTNAYSEIVLPLASDAADASAWYYPMLRYAVSAVMIHVAPDGKLHPDGELTRGQVALETYYLAMYQAGKRTQAGLSAEESDLVNTLTFLEQKDFANADTASARALIVSRGSLTGKPDVPIVKAAVKIAEAFRGIVRAYKAGVDGKLDDVLTLTKEAWTSAERARTLSPSLQDLATRVQTIAKGMADQARGMIKSGGAASPK